MHKLSGTALKWIVRIELIVACICLAAAAFALCADVIAREILGQGIYGVQKFAVYCCAISGALGMSIVVQSGGHLRITAIDALYRPQALTPVSRLGDLVSASAFLFLAWFAAEFVANTYAFRETDTILQIPIWRVQIILPIAFILAAIKFIVHAAYPAHKPDETAV